MGGEYEFCLIFKDKPFDLKKYQQLVLSLRDEYYSHPKCVFYRTEEEISAVGDNILAKFKYKCKRHAHWRDLEHGTWNILWNPTLDPNYSGDKIHRRCSPATFKTVHDKLVATFPGTFHLYDDDLAEYHYSYYHA